MDREDLITKAEEYEKESSRWVKSAWEKHKEFLRLYPFREHPEEIDLLTPEKIYDPGAGNYFFLWIEHRLKELGTLRIGSAVVWESAKDNIEKLKELLRTSVDDSISISQKIDSHWEDIKWFGGDKMMAKKIIFCYYPDKILPILKTEDLEHFANLLKIDFKKLALESFRKSYEMLSLGEKFEHLNNILLEFKNKESELRKWDNLLFAGFLYDSYQPLRIPAPLERVEPLHPLGILFEPKYEQEVVYLFSVFHRELGFPYIIKIRNEFPDAVVIDEKKNTMRLEFEVRASDFIQHGHDKKGCDFIVCWENDLEAIEDLPQIISLKELIKA